MIDINADRLKFATSDGANKTEPSSTEKDNGYTTQDGTKMTAPNSPLIDFDNYWFYQNWYNINEIYNGKIVINGLVTFENLAVDTLNAKLGNPVKLSQGDNFYKLQTYIEVMSKVTEYENISGLRRDVKARINSETSGMLVSVISGSLGCFYSFSQGRIIIINVLGSDVTAGAVPLGHVSIDVENLNSFLFNDEVIAPAEGLPAAFGGTGTYCSVLDRFYCYQIPSGLATDRLYYFNAKTMQTEYITLDNADVVIDSDKCSGGTTFVVPNATTGKDEIWLLTGQPVYLGGAPNGYNYLIKMDMQGNYLSSTKWNYPTGNGLQNHGNQVIYCPVNKKAFYFESPNTYIANALFMYFDVNTETPGEYALDPGTGATSFQSQASNCATYDPLNQRIYLMSWVGEAGVPYIDCADLTFKILTRQKKLFNYDFRYDREVSNNDRVDSSEERIVISGGDLRFFCTSQHRDRAVAELTEMTSIKVVDKNGVAWVLDYTGCANTDVFFNTYRTMSGSGRDKVTLRANVPGMTITKDGVISNAAEFAADFGVYFKEDYNAYRENNLNGLFSIQDNTTTITNIYSESGFSAKTSKIYFYQSNQLGVTTAPSTLMVDCANDYFYFDVDTQVMNPNDDINIDASKSCQIPELDTRCHIVADISYGTLQTSQVGCFTDKKPDLSLNRATVLARSNSL